jgi:hypothetical protein
MASRRGTCEVLVVVFVRERGCNQKSKSDLRPHARECKATQLREVAS